MGFNLAQITGALLLIAGFVFRFWVSLIGVTLGLAGVILPELFSRFVTFLSSVVNAAQWFVEEFLGQQLGETVNEVATQTTFIFSHVAVVNTYVPVDTGAGIITGAYALKLTIRAARHILGLLPGLNAG